MLDLNLLRHLLPDPNTLRLQHAEIDDDKKHIILNVIASQTQASCPLCQHPSQRIHSAYQRTLTDLNWTDITVTLKLKVHKFFCDNPQCQRRIFAQRFPQVVEPWARRTQRMTQQLTAITLALGGNPAARLCKQLGYAFSRNTLLRALAKLNLPQPKAPYALGVDDFAFRKHHRYGTVLVDLDQHTPIALLKDRKDQTLQDWLAQHPGSKFVARDRSKAYRHAIQTAAPNATQVADRFHLLQNLVDPLEQVFSNHLKALYTAQDIPEAETPEPDKTPEPEIPVPQSRPHPAQQPAQLKQTQKKVQYQTLIQLHQQGQSQADIAKHLHISTRTVSRWLNNPAAAQRQPRSDKGTSHTLAPFEHILLQHWSQSTHKARVLFRILQKHGYPGSYMTVARYVRRLRQAQGLPITQLGKSRPHHPHPTKLAQPFSPRQAAFLVLLKPENRNPKQTEILQKLTQPPEFNSAIHLAQDFINLVRHRLAQQLDDWLKQALNSALPAFRRFAKSLKQDYDAVKAGLTLPYSNGPTEGLINRLKMIKRQMFGRASLDLLAHRFLLAQ